MNVSLSDIPEAYEKGNDTQIFSIAMAPELKKLQSRSTSDYLTGDWEKDPAKLRLMNRIVVATSEITAEIHSRASFGVSCLVLVMVGTALGMLLRSGDFLSAFAVSVIPARSRSRWWWPARKPQPK